MSTETLTFTFKNVHNGKPIQASQIPPLPPAAVRAMLRILHEKSIALSFAANSPFYAEVMAELATEIVSIALRRVEPTVTLEVIEQDESYSEVFALFQYIQKTNPAIFPAGSDSETPAGGESPKSVPPA